MEKQNNKLKDNELKELGHQLSEIKDILGSVNVTNDCLDMLKKHDTEVYLFLVNKFLNNQYEVIEKLIFKIDRMAYKLQVCDDEEELRSI